MNSQQRRKVMEKGKRTLITVVAVALALVFVATAAPAPAQDGITPSVGYVYKPFNQGDKVTFNMKDYSSMVVRFVAADTSKTTQVELWGTTASNNNQFQQCSSFGVAINADCNTASFWSKSRGCDGNLCPKIQFRCKKNNCNKLKIMELR
jgi:hypothetical protein